MMNENENGKPFSLFALDHKDSEEQENETADQPPFNGQGCSRVVQSEIVNFLAPAVYRALWQTSKENRQLLGPASKFIENIKS